MMGCALYLGYNIPRDVCSNHMANLLDQYYAQLFLHHHLVELNDVVLQLSGNHGKTGFL